MMDGYDSTGVKLTPQEERRLIEGARCGNSGSAHTLIGAYQDRLHAFVWRMIRNRHDAEEICQDTFLRAFQALDTFDFTYRFSTWLFTIAYRLCLNLLRRRRDYAGDVDFSTMSPRRNGEPVSDVGDQVASSDEARRLKTAIWESVEQLTPQQRATVLLFYRESLSCQEIGEILEMPAATVKSHLHRARSRLRELLGSQMATDWSEVRFSVTGGGS
jgi:RNA polymerase sigma-70 factor, ECF subfamily